MLIYPSIRRENCLAPWEFLSRGKGENSLIDCFLPKNLYLCNIKKILRNRYTKFIDIFTNQALTIISRSKKA